MFRFECDYCEGAHPLILQALAKTNLEQTPGYGLDPYCARAAARIRQICEAPKADVHFLVGGTQANTTVIAAALRPWQGAVAVSEGHIAVHETGAIEAAGHKVLTLPPHNGKMDAQDLRALCKAHFDDSSREHTVQPGIVYISHPTETGTLYTLHELEALRAVCDTYGLPLFLDGARLAYGLAAEGTDLTLGNLARLCDVFYIGGTKAGALFGEAVVITNDSLKKDFRYNIKQRGGMLAKGRLLGIQFDTLLRNSLYLQIGQHADRLALQIRRTCLEKGLPMAVDSPTNQQFFVFPDTALAKLEQNFTFSPICKPDASHTEVRICTSWASTDTAVNALCSAISAL
ncbi:threonine aldolase family protein [Caproicibacterium sp. XB1]|uniref:threonine aldolase family protein n=1 Tax=Caproicibacterium sp. XB1 TaxID=3396405 RepID=UPI0039B6FD7D